MPHNPLPPLLSGTLFGASLTASSVYLPSIILSQLSLTSTHMLKTFLTASAISAIIIYITNKLGYARLPHRTNTSYGWFGAYDANLVGGLLQGLGMALTGACPGTVLVQVALGMGRAGWVLVGGLLGGMGFVGLSPLVRRTSGVQSGDGAVKEHTVMQRLKVQDETAVLGYEAMLIGMIALVDRLGLSKDGRSFWVDPVVGGMMIGVAQASSVLLSKNTLGVSSAYSDIAGHLSSLVRGKGLSGGFGNVIFAAGVMLGAKLASQRVPVVVESAPAVSVGAAIFGGFCSIFGARLAGGCTSGHGISGMSTLSVSSFVTVAGMFGGGIAC
ncbi:hypothetical protein OHC33_007128 [Knufia fluminis]|uniref:Sulphur transport domain-containing protein n=1 Tax=Knufia fluminis TaxID=191047 RepID=A0AAN8F5K7_9EURO|nr:hypothetical protein OHC33_007128 [Knufia fluminis]